MSKKSASTGTCCLPSVEGLTYLKIGPRGYVVGLMGLDKVFQQLDALGRRPDEATDAELVGMARRFNYIPDRPTVEADFAVALRRAYAAYFSRQGQNHEHSPK